MDLLLLPPAVWANVASKLRAEDVARLSMTCKAAKARDEDTAQMVWQRLVVKELRLPGQAVKTRAAVVCPRSVYGDLRSLRAAQWIKPKQPVDGPLTRNGGGLARLGRGPEIILFGGSKHRTSRSSSHICNELSVLHLKASCAEATGGPLPPRAALELTAEWDMKPTVHGTPPSPRWGHTFTSLVDPPDGQDAVLVFGGFGRGCIHGDAHLLKRCAADPSALIWEELQLQGDPPERRAFHTATELLPGVVLVSGGLVEEGTSTDMVLLDLAARRWFRPACSPGIPRAGHAAVFVPSLEGGSFLGRLWMMGGCLRTQIEDQFHASASVLGVRKAASDSKGCCASTLRLEWLHEEVENVNVMGRCPLYGRVGRNILLWGGFSSSWLREFAQEWMAIDDEKMVARSLAPVDSGVPPEAREGGSCVEVLDCAEFHGLVVFGGATFSSSSRVTDVHVLLISSRPEEPAVPT